MRQYFVALAGNHSYTVSMQRLLITTILSVICSELIAQEADSKITIMTSPEPAGWVVAAFLAVAVIALTGLIFAITKKNISKTSSLKKEALKEVEENYARKVRKEYLAKQETLDNKINQVRVRFSMVMSRVKTLLDTLDPDKLFNAICELIETDIGAKNYILFLIDPERNELYPFRWQGYNEKIQKALILPLKYPHMLCMAIKRRQNIFRADGMSDPELAKIIENKPDLNTIVAIPLFTRNKLFGVIHIENFEDGHKNIDDNEARFLGALPSFIGSALTNADIFMQTRDELVSAKKVTEKEIAEKRRIHDMFSRYTSAELIDNLLKHPEKIDLGGVTKNASILFSDIAGFTHFSSKLSPKEVVIAMNEYLSRMTEVVLDYQGEIDKFIGDSVMARFGVLSDLPYPSKNAMEAARAMLVELEKLKAEWAQRGMECFNIRIGIATGPVLAGNIGSTRRQEFTVMGTTVNLASRLESFNKQLGTRVAIDEETFKFIPQAEYNFEKHENQSIRGLDTPVNVYTLK